MWLPANSVGRGVLAEDHYDHDKIKERIIEYLAVRKLRRDRGVNESSNGHHQPEPIHIHCPHTHHPAIFVS